ncbi:MarR family transcriptional regulator [Aeromicrobium sp. PE09-221]|uniref:MarR family transcriptional regulator n=1 Tax=Aeromicrobium sp. PE09-221 TaxID=1898043 RepID=UPI001F1C6005|nr:MarR family transcriptional regulator [Aeromicrobium sp. PE09-221]
MRRTPRGSLSRAAGGTLTLLYEHGPQRITTLAEREAVSQPAMTALVRRMENAGLVTRRRAQYDELIGEALDRLSDDDRASIAAALPALENFVRTYDFH